MGLRKTLRRLVSEQERLRARDIASARNFLAISPNSRLLSYHDLPPNPTVIDVGGYKGDWAAQVLSVHDDATMHIFEPVPAFADYLKGRFAAKSSVHIHASGLGARDEDVEIGLSEDATSAYRQSGQTQTVSVRALATFLREHNITGIDLMAINAEGAEFDLLDHMIAEGLVETVHRLLVQFHRVVPKAAERRTTIQNRLRESHDCVFDFPFCWELWAKRAMPQ